MIRDDAVILRTLDYSRSSMIAVLACRAQGLVHVLAKGIRRSRRRFSPPAPPGLFSSGEVMYYPRRSGLMIMSDWYEYRSGLGLSSPLKRYYAASHICELTSALLRPHSPDSERLYMLADGALRETEHASGELLRVLLAAFQLRVLAVSGLTPEFGRCTVCESVPGRGESATFDSEHGGIVCRRCAPVARGSMNVTDTVRRLATQVLAGRMPAEADYGALGRVATINRAFISHVLERELKTANAARRIIAARNGRRSA